MFRHMLAILVVLITVNIAAAQPRPGSPTELPGLIAYFSLDEGKGTEAADVSPSKMTAALKGGKWIPGVKGTALQFEKLGEFLDYGHSPNLNFAADAPFTYAGWMKTKTQRGPVVSQRNNKDGGAVIDITVEGGKLDALIRSDGKENGVGHARVKTAADVSDGEWHHFAVTRKGGDIELFLDGDSQGKANGADAGGPITTDLRALGSERIWARDPFPFHQFIGAIDEFCVYDRALTPEQIRKLAGPKPAVVVKVDSKTKIDPKSGPKVPLNVVRYEGNGVAFDYPKGWKANAENIGIASITVQNDKGTQALLQVHPPGSDAAASRKTMEDIMRKAFDNKVLPGSEKAAKRKIAGVMSDGKELDIEIAKDLAMHFEFHAVPLGKGPVVVAVFQHSAFDADAARSAFALIAGSLTTSAKTK